MMWKFSSGVPLLVLSALASIAASVCTPDVPESLLYDTEVLKHPLVAAALEEVESQLSGLYNTTRDGLSVAVVHATSETPIYTFNNGTLKINETDTSNTITSDSIFRVMSVSKNFAMASALIVGAQQDEQQILHTRVREILPAFSLPDRDWKSGGSEITLGMLAAHMSGIPRESYSTAFNVILGTDRADVARWEKGWGEATIEGVLEAAKHKNLMFAPGDRAAYSNVGISILGTSVAAYYNNATGNNMTWSEVVTEEVFSALNMTHTFLGPVSQDFLEKTVVPGAPNFADLIVGEGYNPAAGMWSSADDLSKYLYNLWLRTNPSLITPFQRRQSLKPSTSLMSDGQQMSGTGWEIETLVLPTETNSTNTTGPEPDPSPPTKTYTIYGKSGDGGGYHAWIDVLPNLGYGLVILVQNSNDLDYAPLSQTVLRDAVHEILAPAMAAAYADRLAQRFAGTYTMGQDTGLLVDQVPKNASLPENESTPATYAHLEVQDQILYLRTLIVNGTSALSALDRLSWPEDALSGPQLYSTDVGVPLTASSGAGETAEYGEGAQVFRLEIPGLQTCDYWDYDGYLDTRGWPLGKLVIVEGENGVELFYPPFDVVVRREGAGSSKYRKVKKRKSRWEL